jgi:hypothetical protein
MTLSQIELAVGLRGGDFNTLTRASQSIRRGVWQKYYRDHAAGIRTDLATRWPHAIVAASTWHSDGQSHCSESSVGTGARGSRPVLREPEGATPLGYSPADHDETKILAATITRFYRRHR